MKKNIMDFFNKKTREKQLLQQLEHELDRSIRSSVVGQKDDLHRSRSTIAKQDDLPVVKMVTRGNTFALGHGESLDHSNMFDILHECAFRRMLDDPQLALVYEQKSDEAVRIHKGQKFTIYNDDSGKPQRSDYTFKIIFDAVESLEIYKAILEENQRERNERKAEVLSILGKQTITNDSETFQILYEEALRQKGEIEECQIKIEKLQTDNYDLWQQNKKIKFELNAAKQLNKVLVGDIDSKKETIEGLQEKVIRLQRDKGELRNMWNHEAGKTFLDNQNLKQKIDRLMREIEKINDQKSELELKNSLLMTEIKEIDLKNKVQNMVRLQQVRLQQQRQEREQKSIVVFLKKNGILQNIAEYLTHNEYEKLTFINKQYNQELYQQIGASIQRKFLRISHSQLQSQPAQHLNPQPVLIKAVLHQSELFEMAIVNEYENKEETPKNHVNHINEVECSIPVVPVCEQEKTQLPISVIITEEKDIQTEPKVLQEHETEKDELELDAVAFELEILKYTFDEQIQTVESPKQKEQVFITDHQEIDVDEDEQLSCMTENHSVKSNINEYDYMQADMDNQDILQLNDNNRTQKDMDIFEQEYKKIKNNEMLKQIVHKFKGNIDNRIGHNFEKVEEKATKVLLSYASMVYSENELNSMKIKAIEDSYDLILSSDDQIYNSMQSSQQGLKECLDKFLNSMQCQSNKNGGLTEQNRYQYSPMQDQQQQQYLQQPQYNMASDFMSMSDGSSRAHQNSGKSYDRQLQNGFVQSFNSADEIYKYLVKVGTSLVVEREKITQLFKRIQLSFSEIFYFGRNLNKEFKEFELYKQYLAIKLSYNKHKILRLQKNHDERINEIEKIIQQKDQENCTMQQICDKLQKQNKSYKVQISQLKNQISEQENAQQQTIDKHNQQLLLQENRILDKECAIRELQAKSKQQDKEKSKIVRRLEKEKLVLMRQLNCEKEQIISEKEQEKIRALQEKDTLIKEKEIMIALKESILKQIEEQKNKAIQENLENQKQFIQEKEDQQQRSEMFIKVLQEKSQMQLRQTREELEEQLRELKEQYEAQYQELQEKYESKAHLSHKIIKEQSERIGQLQKEIDKLEVINKEQSIMVDIKQVIEENQSLQDQIERLKQENATISNALLEYYQFINNQIETEEKSV